MLRIPGVTRAPRCTGLLRYSLVLLALFCATLAACSGGSAPSNPPTRRASAAPGSPAPQQPSARSQQARGPVTFAFAGDTQFVAQQDTDPGATSTGTPLLADRLRASPNTVLAPVAPVLSSADLAMVNLETAITDRGEPVPEKQYHFRSPAASFTALRASGVDVVNMANNHALDYGPVGMQDTFAAISGSGLPVLGIGRNADDAFRPFRTTIKGQRIGILSAVDWLEAPLIPKWSATDTHAGLAFSIDRTRLIAAVHALRPKVDTLVVVLHWGTEQTHCASDEQQSLARALSSAGADIIVGSHAHQVFGAGRLGSTFVAYGLGNFTYFREDGESGRSGILLVAATGRRVHSYSWVPARITHGIPVPEAGPAAAADIEEWQTRRICSGLSS